MLDVIKCAPTPIDSHIYFQGMFGGAHPKSAELAQQYSAMTDFLKVDFLDAGQFLGADGCDGILHRAKQPRPR